MIRWQVLGKIYLNFNENVIIYSCYILYLFAT